MNLHEHCLRNVAGALRDIARTEHPDLTFEVGVLEGGGFRPFPAGPINVGCRALNQPIKGEDKK